MDCHGVLCRMLIGYQTLGVGFERGGHGYWLITLVMWVIQLSMLGSSPSKDVAYLVGQPGCKNRNFMLLKKIRACLQVTTKTLDTTCHVGGSKH